MLILISDIVKLTFDIVVLFINLVIPKLVVFLLEDFGFLEFLSKSFNTWFVFAYSSKLFSLFSILLLFKGVLGTSKCKLRSFSKKVESSDSCTSEMFPIFGSALSLIFGDFIKSLYLIK